MDAGVEILGADLVPCLYSCHVSSSRSYCCFWVEFIETLQQEFRRDVVKQCGELFLLVLLSYFPYAFQSVPAFPTLGSRRLAGVPRSSRSVSFPPRAPPHDRPRLGQCLCSLLARPFVCECHNISTMRLIMLSFARFFGTMSCPTPYHVRGGIAALAFSPMGPRCGGAFSGSPGSRAWSFHTCLGSSTPPRWPATRVTATCHVAFPYKPLGRHVEMVISELYSLPACAPVTLQLGVTTPAA